MTWQWTRERVLLLAALVATASAWAFVYIADEAGEAETRPVEVALMRAFRTADGSPLGPPWMVSAARDVTSLGGYPLLTLTTLLALGLLALERRPALMLVVAGASVGGGVLSAVLKNAFARPRPEVTSHLVAVDSSSFPSGHSMASAAVYVTLGALLARTTPRLAMKLYFVGAALLVTFLVGVSRVYLGVHYPTDVLAGWTAGIAWAVLCQGVAVALQRRGSVEPPT
jgi:undecaprenyl-diphosphatase